MFDSEIQAPLTTAFADSQCAASASPYKAARAQTEAPAHLWQHATVPMSDSEFKALYDTHSRLVWRALSRLGVRDADLMDLTQKVFLIAYLKLPEFEGRSALSTWLWGICRRVAIAYRRSSAIRCEVAIDPLHFEAWTEQSSAAASEIDTARQVAAERILNKLSEPQRVVFTLFEVEGLGGPEIAARLKISVGTVRSRLRYARKVLRREARRFVLSGAPPRARAALSVRACGEKE